MPRLQGWQALPFTKVPAGQTAQLPVDALGTLPGAHGVHAVDALLLKVPPAHGVHPASEGDARKVPAVQATLLARPAAV